MEVAAAATIGELKAQIAALYGVPADEQRLQLSFTPSDECFADSIPAAWAARLGQLHLVPSPNFDLADEGSQPGREARATYFHGLEELCQTQAAAHAVAQSLQGATYHVHVLCPKLLGSRLEGQSLTLEVDALCLVEDLLSAVDRECFGDAAGSQPLVLSTEGRVLPTDLPLHFVGVRDGERLLLTRLGDFRSDSEREEDDDNDDDDDSDADSFDNYMQSWAASR